ncbi:TetR/AcrR family transcriptional regulator [Paroceanicella profunda]|uniref:TetR/AcrR family transcriptional regulator n=1 Tax=Paroceanicella profunda TaxID=2579971 RepID=UPI00197F083B|nr:TetR/AcrR family transcriptional regulator [Paroceanicella profunda]
MDDTLEDGSASTDTAKRRQILNGAAEMFLAQGFDATSMGQIAKHAGVSKGTLYVYFDSKETLFSAMVACHKERTAEQWLLPDPECTDVEATLLELSCNHIERLTDPKHVKLVRMVIAASERFPVVGQRFYEAGPALGARRLAGWLDTQVARGSLVIPDTTQAAWQLLGMLHHPTLVAVAMGGHPRPPREDMQEVARGAVRTFMAAYGPR